MLDAEDWDVCQDGFELCFDARELGQPLHCGQVSTNFQMQDGVLSLNLGDREIYILAELVES